MGFFLVSLCFFFYIQGSQTSCDVGIFHPFLSCLGEICVAQNHMLFPGLDMNATLKSCQCLVQLFYKKNSRARTSSWRHELKRFSSTYKRTVQVLLLYFHVCRWRQKWTWNKDFIQLVWILVCFTVKSADSGIQNSADGSREKLANTPSNNSIADAG